MMFTFSNRLDSLWMREKNEARETAEQRVESARGTMRRRAEGDLRDAAERLVEEQQTFKSQLGACLLYTSPSPRDQRGSRMPSSA